MLNQRIDLGFADATHRKITIYEEEVAISEVLERQLDEAQPIHREGDIEYLRPQLHRELLDNDETLERIVIGGHQEPTEDDKVSLKY